MSIPSGVERARGGSFATGLVAALLATSTLGVFACGSSSSSKVDGSAGAGGSGGVGGGGSGGAAGGGGTSGSGGAAGQDGGPSSGDGSSNRPAGPVAGAQDMHCAMMQARKQMVSLDPAVCSFKPDGGPSDAGDLTPDYGAPMFNSEADDDDCKYHVMFTVSPVAQNQDVFFTVTFTYKADGKPVVPVNGVTLAQMLAPEVSLTDTHPAPNTNYMVTDGGAPGVYKLGPIRFDAPGQWMIRFHIREDCSDIPQDSPHGHVAFFINVP